MINCVESICLEDMIKELDEPVIDYLKMDCETSEYHILFEKDLTIFNYIGIEVHAQPGELKHSQLISHIKTTHQLVSGDATYKSNLNNELFFKRLEWVMKQVYYFKEEELTGSARNLLSGTYKGYVVNEPSDHNSEKSIEIFNEFMQKNQNIKFNIISDNEDFCFADLTNVRIGLDWL